jgi:predicted glycosyltransferase involved in capsule biosynthesis
MYTQHKAGIVVPYRDREYHLELFIPKIVEILKFRNINYQIYIVEQDAGKPFNTGMLKNIGTILSIIDGCDYIVFNDVDTIPTSYDIFYDYPGEKVNHLFGYTMSLGGALSLSVEIVERINGFNNNFWGWGFEDTDLKFKIEMCGIMIDETDSVFSNIDIDENKPMNERKFLWLNNCDTHIRTSLSDGVTNEEEKNKKMYYCELNKRQYEKNKIIYNKTGSFHDGLSTTDFKVNFKKNCGDYTLINVSI